MALAEASCTASSGCSGWIDVGVSGDGQGLSSARSKPPRNCRSAARATRRSGLPAKSLGPDLVEVQGAADRGVAPEVEDESFSNQARGAGLIAGGQKMPGRRAYLAGVSQVLGGPLMHAPLTRRIVEVKLGLQDFFDQLVVAIRSPRRPPE